MNYKDLGTLNGHLDVKLIKLEDILFAINWDLTVSFTYGKKVLLPEKITLSIESTFETSKTSCIESSLLFILFIPSPKYIWHT